MDLIAQNHCIYACHKSCYDASGLQHGSHANQSLCLWASRSAYIANSLCLVPGSPCGCTCCCLLMPAFMMMDVICCALFLCIILQVLLPALRDDVRVLALAADGSTSSSIPDSPAEKAAHAHPGASTSRADTPEQCPLPAAGSSAVGSLSASRPYLTCCVRLSEEKEPHRCVVSIKNNHVASASLRRPCNTHARLPIDQQ